LKGRQTSGTACAPRVTFKRTGRALTVGKDELVQKIQRAFQKITHLGR